MTKSRVPKTPTVHVMFDTNVIYSNLAEKLISDDVSGFILKECPALGIEIIWYLPEIAVKERKHQMNKKGMGLLIPLEKLENLLGHKLNFTQDILELRVDEAIKRQLELHNLQVHSALYNKIDWDKFIERAAFKLPPFAIGDNEKGFKDAIILESFDQLAQSLPRSYKSCRVTLITDDGLLKEAAQERTKNMQNVSILSNILELKTMLNSVAAHLDKEDVDQIIAKASPLFFDADNKEGLYYKWDIAGRIRSDFANVMFQPPASGFKVSTKRFLIYNPTFLAKEGQKLRFSSTVTVELEAEKTEYVPQIASSQIANLGLLGSISADRIAASNISPQNRTFGFLGSQPPGPGMPANPPPSSDQVARVPHTVRKNGQQSVEINWSATLNRVGNLVQPALGVMSPASNSWSE